MSHPRSIGTLIPMMAFAASGFALAATHVDGKLPVYPNAIPRGFTWDTPKIDQALKMGFGIFADSSDSVDTVSAWYAKHLPKSCLRQTNGIAAAYHCSTGTIAIRKDHGKTFIMITPS